MPRLPPTELNNPRSRALGGSLRQALAVLHEGDLEAVRAVGRALPALARLAEEAATALQRGGRIVYIGAGTSGRLAALDAAECPPTFGMPPSRVIALVAGGSRALRQSVEGAEDDGEAGRTAVRRAAVGPLDLTIGVSASGTTRFVLAALDEARHRRAATCLITSNPSARHHGMRVLLRTGRELVAGSTRMKAGSATKMALSLFSTGAMLRLGRVREGRMVDLSPTNQKLRDRAVRIVMELGGADRRTAEDALASNGWRVRAALDARSRSCARRQARSGNRGRRWAPKTTCQ